MGIVRNKLFENPDGFAHPDTGTHVGNDIKFISAGPRAFGYYENKLFMGDYATIHGNIPELIEIVRKKEREDGKTYVTRDIMDISGRLWENLKIISFWIYPSKEEFPRVIKEIGESIGLPDMYNDPEWRVEIIAKKLADYDKNGWDNSEVKTDFISFKDYVGSSERSPEELAKPHIDSPMVKKAKVKPGFGSLNPKYAGKEKEKRYMYAESLNIIKEELFGTNIYESTDHKELVKFIYSEITFPEFLLEKLLIGEPITVPELRDILHKKIVNFEFIKLDGNIRPAKGTTMMKYIPKENHPSGSNPSSEKVAAFWDLSKGTWRSVSNRSKEIVIQQDDETGKPKVVVSDKKPAAPAVKEPKFDKGKSYAYTTNRGITTDVEVLQQLPNGEYQVYSPEFKTKFAVGADRLGSEIGGKPEMRPIPEPVKPIVRPTVRPEAPMPIPIKPEEIPEPPVSDVPLNLDDATKLADEIRDTEIIAPGVKRPAYPNEPLGIEPVEQEPEEDPLPPKEEITFRDEESEEPEEFEDGENPSFDT